MGTKVVIMCGISGGGKSTEVAKITSKASIICSADHFFMENGVYKFSPYGLNQAHKECFWKFLTNLQEIDNGTLLGVDVVVVDNTNLTAVEIAPYLVVAEAFDCEIEIVTVHCAPDVAYLRNAHDVPLKSIIRMDRTLRARVFPPHWNVKMRAVDTNPPPDALEREGEQRRQAFESEQASIQ